ncbi:MAG TPA: response regulator [Candidatus Acidoferrales bacterium]|nr:response regulator [Candidatus Acidoferrales bacterium]
MSKKRILVIDDDEAIREPMKKILELEGYHVDTAKNGEEAIEHSKTNFYNLALIDIRLPDIEGTQLLTAMRDTVPKMVKIILTGYPSVNNAIDAVNKGADGYVTKPVTDIDSFLQKIKELLKKQEESEQFSETKVADFVKSRVKKLEAEKPRS